MVERKRGFDGTFSRLSECPAGSQWPTSLTDDSYGRTPVAGVGGPISVKQCVASGENRSFAVTLRMSTSLLDTSHISVVDRTFAHRPSEGGVGSPL